jgi:hypothetical protein
VLLPEVAAVSRADDATAAAGRGGIERHDAGGLAQGAHLQPKRVAEKGEINAAWVLRQQVEVFKSG